MSKLKAKAPGETSPGHCKGLLFGKAGAGKTWFALNFPSPYYIDTEGGAKLAHYQNKLAESGGAYLGPEDGAAELDTIIEQVKALATEQHQYRTLIIDSITRAFQNSIAREQERLGERDAFGASKKPAVSQMRRLLNWLLRLDMNVWLIAHEVSIWESVAGERKEVGRGPDVWDKVPYELDLAFRVEHLSKSRRIMTVTKSRLTGFPEYDQIILQDGGEDLGYTEFSGRYGQDYIDAEPQKVALADAEMVVRINQLFASLRMEDAEISKLLAKVNADSVEELSAKHAVQLVKSLRSKLDA